MKSPFKFLDAYGADDRAVFFGREEETRQLYDMVLKNRLLLVYGQSGTGKTSLVQCGLASRFDVTDWYPLFIRRQGDLNQSVKQRLGQVLGKNSVDSIESAVQEVYFNFLRPVYLIFDQLEELFILGSEAEQATFIHAIQALMDSGVPCRVIFIIREEYLAYLYGFEQVIPTLFDRRMRVEPMGIAKVKQVLNGSFEKFNIQVEAPSDETLNQILENLSGGKAGIQLPYLQVYLDLLYREDFARTYPGRQPGEDGVWQSVEFTRAEIKALGKIENVLEKFLREQQERIQQHINQQFTGADPEAVKKVLDAFVSEEGTKKPVPYQRKGERLQLDSKLELLLQPLPPAMIAEICQALEQSRILRFEDAHVELAHDALAVLIDNQRTAEQRRLRDALNRLNSGYHEYRQSGEYLSRKQLNSLEELLPELDKRLSKEVRQFISDSQEQALKLEQAELAAERRKRKQARRIAVAGFSLALIALFGLFTAYNLYLKSSMNAAEARLNYAQMLKVEGKYPEALVQLEEIKKFPAAAVNKYLATVTLSSDAWQEIQRLVKEGDAFSQQADYRLAAERYTAARKIEDDAHLKSLEEQAQTALENRFAEAMRNGQLLMSTRGSMPEAIRNFETALKLKPEDATALKRLEACKKAQ